MHAQASAPGNSADAVLVYARACQLLPMQQMRHGACACLFKKKKKIRRMMRSWRMLVHASASSGVGVQSWCMPRACQCIQRYGDVVLVCTRMPVRPVLKKCGMRSWCLLVHTSASSTVGMQSWCMPRACQCIQRSGDVVLVCTRMPVRPGLK